MTPGLLFVFYVLLLTALLLYPVSQWIWALSVRRLQKRLDRELAEDEIAGQKRRAWVIAAFICPVFSLLFNLSTVGMPQ